MIGTLFFLSFWGLMPYFIRNILMNLFDFLSNLIILIFNSVHSAAETMISHFFVRRPKISEAIFFPSEESEMRLINLLKKPKNSMLVCVFTITNNRLADQIYLNWQKNVDVKVISDDECSKQLGSDVFDLANAGIPVRLDNSPSTHMHNKFVILDKRIVITGSFNWTTSAVDSNQENLCILDNEELAAKYIVEFEKLWKKFEKWEMKNNGVVIKRFAKLRIE